MKEIDKAYAEIDARTESILVRTAHQHEWAAICNTGNPVVPGNSLSTPLDRFAFRQAASR
jgi:hypothetical protein